MNLDLYIKATTAFADLLRQAALCKELYEGSGSPAPEPLKALLGEHLPSPTRARRPEPEPRLERTLTLPPRPRDEMYVGRRANEISVRADEATIPTLILALTRGTRFGSPQALQIAVRTHQPLTVSNSVYNSIKRLVGERKLLTDEHGGFSSAADSDGPYLEGSLIWGNPETLYPTDVAAFRREVELALVRANSGATLMQLLRALESLSWFPKKFNKDTLKSDLLGLKTAGLVTRNGKDWIAVKKEAPIEETS